MPEHVAFIWEGQVPEGFVQEAKELLSQLIDEHQLHGSLTVTQLTELERQRIDAEVGILVQDTRGIRH